MWVPLVLIFFLACSAALWMLWPEQTLREPYRGDLDVAIISLPERKKEFFDRLASDLAEYQIRARWAEGIRGKGLSLDQPEISPKYRQFFEKNRAEFAKGETTKLYDGHLGCTLTHLREVKHAQGRLLILEDDAILADGFAALLEKRLQSLEGKDWDMLVLGLACQYNHSNKCHENDDLPLEHGLTRIKYWFGGWAYLIRDKAAADKIVKLLTPLHTHFDLSCAEMARTGKLNVYATIPALVFHPGVLRVDSFDYTQTGDTRKARYRTDTNA